MKRNSLESSKVAIAYFERRPLLRWSSFFLLIVIGHVIAAFFYSRLCENQVDGLERRISNLETKKSVLESAIERLNKAYIEREGAPGPPSDEDRAREGSRRVKSSEKNKRP